MCTVGLPPKLAARQALIGSWASANKKRISDKSGHIAQRQGSSAHLLHATQFRAQVLTNTFDIRLDQIWPRSCRTQPNSARFGPSPANANPISPASEKTWPECTEFAIPGRNSSKLAEIRGNWLHFEFGPDLVELGPTWPICLVERRVTRSLRSE